MSRLNCILNKNSKISLKHKVTIFKRLFVQFWHTVALFLRMFRRINWSLCRLFRIDSSERSLVQSRNFRTVNLHHDFKVESLANFMQMASRRFYDKVPHNKNPLISNLADYTPVPTLVRITAGPDMYYLMMTTPSRSGSKTYLTMTVTKQTRLLNLMSLTMTLQI